MVVSTPRESRKARFEDMVKLDPAWTLGGRKVRPLMPASQLNKSWTVGSELSSAHLFR